ncbi:hypothetical protein N9R79_05190 [Vibrio sp.]|nr:hypothetical protein [Vibrio sp.]
MSKNICIMFILFGVFVLLTGNFNFFDVLNARVFETLVEGIDISDTSKMQNILYGAGTAFIFFGIAGMARNSRK